MPPSPVPDTRPGLQPQRLLHLMRSAVERLKLDLSGAVVLTEAASGPYVVTPVLAALAGASRVIAVTRTTRYGTVEEIGEQTLALADLAGVSGIEVVSEKRPEHLAAADIVTNSGHLRPLDRASIRAMKDTAVIPLMFESWEFRPEDLDLSAAVERGIPVAGTDECHPDVDVFSYLGLMAVKQMLDAQIPARHATVLLLCDNPFAEYMERDLAAAGAEVHLSRWLGTIPGRCDAVIVATAPGWCALGEREAEQLRAAGSPAVLHYWGEIDREALEAAQIPCWPPQSPTPGHMGVLPSAVGPDPVVRLQSGGLKVGEVLWRLRQEGLSGAELAERLKNTGYGTMLPPAGA